jgi:serine acetyltransferase
LDSLISSEDSRKNKHSATKDLDLSNYLESIVSKLQIIRSKNNAFSKEETYAELLRFIRNCEKLELDFDLLIGSKLGKYIHLAYVMLIEINDTSSIGYMRLLPRISKIRK